ncbi:MAG TPA: glycosyltransferase family 2 protein [Patescibacteria group bacterium]|nr:glycosyltransferase family 2 protein [Patescibacteria group bacterium]
MKTCVVVPTYNESGAIGSVLAQIKKQGLDVVVVDDGSQDNTVAIAERCGAVVLRSDRNEGKGASLVKGFRYCLSKDFDAVITMDGDGQHVPQDIAQFLRQARVSGAGIFIGTRMSKTKHMPPLRFLTNRFMSWFISQVTGQYIPDTQCGFRLIRRQVLEKFVLKSRKYEIESEMLIQAARLGAQIESVPIETVYSGQKSQINPCIDTWRFIRFIFRELWNTQP